MKIYTCLWILLLMNITSQLTDCMDFSILSTFALLQSQNKRSYGGEYSILRLSLHCVVWRWQFECKDGWTPLSNVTFGWWVNVRSMQDEDWGRRWVGCDISWWNPCILVRDSSCVPAVVLSLGHQTEESFSKSTTFCFNKSAKNVKKWVQKWKKNFLVC